MDSLQPVLKLQDSESKETISSTVELNSRETSHSGNETEKQNKQSKFTGSRLFEILSKLTERVVKSKAEQKTDNQYTRTKNPKAVINTTDKTDRGSSNSSSDHLDSKDSHLVDCFDHEEIIGCSNGLPNNSEHGLKCASKDFCCSDVQTVTHSCNKGQNSKEKNQKKPKSVLDKYKIATNLRSNSFDEERKSKNFTKFKTLNTCTQKKFESHSFQLHLAFVRNLIRKSLTETNPEECSIISSQANNFPLSANSLQTDMLKTLKLAEYRPVSPVEQLKKMKPEAKTSSKSSLKRKKSAGKTTPAKISEKGHPSSKLKVSLKDLFASASSRKSQCDFNNNNNDKEKVPPHLISLLRCGICSTPKKKGRPRKCEHICMAENIMSTQKSGKKELKKENLSDKEDSVVVVHPRKTKQTEAVHCCNKNTNKKHKCTNSSYEEKSDLIDVLFNAKDVSKKSGNATISKTEKLNCSSNSSDEAIQCSDSYEILSDIESRLSQTGDHCYQPSQRNEDDSSYHSHLSETGDHQPSFQSRQTGDLEFQSQMSDHEFQQQLEEARVLLINHWKACRRIDSSELRKFERQNARDFNFNDEAIDMIGDEELYVWQLIEDITPGNPGTKTVED